MYSPITVIEVTAKNATGYPALLGKSAGTVINVAMITTNSTAYVGVRFAPSRRQSW